MRQPIRIIVHLGSGAEGEKRLESLRELAADCHAIGQRSEASVSKLFQMVADKQIILDPAPAVSGERRI